MRVISSYLNSVEAIYFGHPDVLRDVPYFPGNMLKSLIKIETGCVMKFGIRLDKVDSLPSVDDSKFRTFNGQHGCQGCGLGGSSNWPMLVREMKSELVLIIFDRL